MSAMRAELEASEGQTAERALAMEKEKARMDEREREVERRRREEIERGERERKDKEIIKRDMKAKDEKIDRLQKELSEALERQKLMESKMDGGEREYKMKILNYEKNFSQLVTMYQSMAS